MTAICWALAALFAYLVLAPAPQYDLQQTPTAHPMSPHHAPTTP
ncbi:hypothetical protein ACFC8N_42785 [Streptomyces sp. NPDC055966]